MLFTTYLYENIKNEIDNIQTKDKNILMLLKAFVRAYLKKFFLRLSTAIFLGLPGLDSLKESQSKQHKTEIKGPTKYWFMDDMLCVWTF